MTTLKLLAGLSLASLTPVAHAASTVLSSAAPSVNILTGSDSPGTSAGLQFDKNSALIDRFGGNTFTLKKKAPISAVTFHLNAVGGSASEKTAAISLVSLDSFSPKQIAYTSLHSETVTFPNDKTLLAGNYITFWFDRPAELDAGTYAILFRWIDNTSHGIRFSHAARANAGTKAFRIVDDPKTGDRSYVITNDDYFYLVHSTPPTDSLATASGDQPITD